MHLLSNTIDLYDSGENPDKKEYDCFFDSIMDYIQCKGLEFDKNYRVTKNKWKLNCVQLSPQQRNGFDCGVYVCTNALFLSRRYKIDYTSEFITKQRHCILSSLLNRKLQLPSN